MGFFDFIDKCAKKVLNTVVEEILTPSADERNNVHPTPSHPKSKRVKSTSKSKKSGWSISDAIDDMTDIFN